MVSTVHPSWHKHNVDELVGRHGGGGDNIVKGRQIPSRQILLCLWCPCKMGTGMAEVVEHGR